MDSSSLEAFAEVLKSKFALPGAASPEDQLKGPVAQLTEVSGASFGFSMASRTETHLSEHKVRPDIAVYVGGLIGGYVELKAPGLGADAPALKGKHNKEQWEKLKGLPNLVYTDGREWALYRGGVRVGEIVRLHGDPTTKGKSAIGGNNVADLHSLLREFLTWKPIVPHRPPELATYLAPLARFLRTEVEAALAIDGSNVGLLAAEWRQFFFPDADAAQFADAYAQTVTYAMLLARLSGATKLDPVEAAKTLNKGNGLLAEALKLLGQDGAREELRVGFEILQRSLESLNPSEFLKSKPDLWLYFYEDFLAAYDPRLRKDFGVYYTPREVVELQVRLSSELLEKRFGKKLGFADDGVVFLDPAVGTGTYLVATVKNALEKVRVRSGSGAVPARAAQMAKNMHGFEILVGPYAVAHLRLTQALEGAMNADSDDGEVKVLQGRLGIYLADTLESPEKAPPGGLDLTHKALTLEHEAAREIKKGGEILVCLGNPPYDRQQLEAGDTETQRKGGWVRFGDQILGGAKVDEQGIRPIFADFTDPASKSGAGLHLKNLYNDYVYFWRWALWRLFEQQTDGGIITFITAASYLAGPGFVGVREVMRRTFDELWILDLGGDNLGTRKTPNVFNIQNPVTIAVGVRGKAANPEVPATVWYAKIDGESREAKLAQLDTIPNFDGVEWHECQSGWHDPLLPAGKGAFFEWPSLRDIFPYQRSGTMTGRPWVIAETKAILETRYKKMTSVDGAERAKLFKDNNYRKVANSYRDHVLRKRLPVLAGEKQSSVPKISRYAFRPFDQQWIVEDIRYIDRMGEALWNCYGATQLYFTTLASAPLGAGPALLASAFVPDKHHFRGSFGGRDVAPLFRDSEGKDPNVNSAMLHQLSEKYGVKVDAVDIAAYVYGLLGGRSYAERFWNELGTPGARVPLTKNSTTFWRVVANGQKLLWLHTFAQRFRAKGRGDEIPPGDAKNLSSISSDPEKYPNTFSYNPEKRELRVGDGRFGPVVPEVWNYEVSGLPVVQSWLGYRMKDRAGKKSSPLDLLRAEGWTPKLTDELLELLWMLEATLAIEPELASDLEAVVGGECFLATELPTPSLRERSAPGSELKPGSLLAMMSASDGDAEDDQDEDEGME
jgi:hypothetical protein